MKLEIKHLAPYLPYGLKCYYPEKLPFSEFFEKKVEQHTAEMGVISMMGVLKGFAKPILRPLSDLTKEIEHNGEKFLPMEKLREIYTERLCFDNNGFYYHIGESLVRGKAHDTHFPFNQLEAYSYLFEWHFDVFNLHENGLCIYYNELKH